MNLLTLAQRTAESAIGSGRIGTPVALRIFDRSLPPGEELSARLAAMLELAGRWFAAPPVAWHALGNGEAGHATLGARFAGGQAAVLTAGAATGLRPLEMLVLGNRGVLSWEPDAAMIEMPCGEDKAGNCPASADSLRAVEQALAQWQPLPVGQPDKTGSGGASASGVQLRPPYGVLLIAGSHTHQENYALSFAADPRCRLVAVTDDAGVSSRRRALNERLARQLGIPYLHDLHEALRRDDVQIVSLCAEPERRGPLAVAAAAAGKHLYLDKPLAGSNEAAAAIVEAVRQAGVASQMFSQVGTPAALRVRAWAKSEQLGELQAMHADLLFAKGDPGTANLAAPRQEQEQPHNFEWVESKREFSNVGVYPLSLAQCLWTARPKRVWAVTGNYFFAEHQANQMEDVGLALVEYEDGRTASILAGRCGWRSHPSHGINRTYLEGSHGAVVVDAFRPRAEIYADEEAWAPPRRHPEDPMGCWSSTIAEMGGRAKQNWYTPPARGANDIVAFVDCLEQGRSPDVPVTAAAAVQQVLMAVYRSAAKSEAVTLD